MKIFAVFCVFFVCASAQLQTNSTLKPSLETQTKPGAKMATEHKEGTPTVTEHPSFDPKEDAKALHKAMKGIGTNEKVITEILSRRTNKQRQEIAQSFQKDFGKSLVKELKKELSGDYLKAIIGLMTPTVEYLAGQLHEAMSGIGTKENTLIDIICSASNHQMKQINDSYYKQFDRTLQKDLAKETSKSFQKLIIKESEGNRKESSDPDLEQAKKDANELMEAAVNDWGHDESVFIRILTNNSFPQLKITFEDYKQLAGKTIEETIANDMSGDVKEALLAIVKSMHNPISYYAERLGQAMKVKRTDGKGFEEKKTIVPGVIQGIGTDEETLTRIIITRCEIDMGEIKVEFLKQHGISLDRQIAADTSGDYKKLLLELIK